MEQDAQQPGFNPFGNLPPEVALVVDAIIARMVKKVDPEIKEIAAILHEHGSAGVTLQMGVKPQAAVEIKEEPLQPEMNIVSPYAGL